MNHFAILEPRVDQVIFDGAEVLVVIVGFRNADDIGHCLTALSCFTPNPRFTICICENGGAAAYESLLSRLTEAGSICDSDATPLELGSPDFVRAQGLRIRADGRRVLIGQGKENFGYAGGINAWLRLAGRADCWKGIWILNPDTQPEIHALDALIACVAERGKGMVGSRIVFDNDPGVVGSRGLKWRLFMSSTKGVDMRAPILPPPDLDDVESRIDAPSGASFYVTRECVETIGLMDDRYFLYFEDLDWGLRAQATVGVGYAYGSIIPHIGGSTIGSAVNRAGRSKLAVYLEFRNRFLFVKDHYPRWFLWTVLMSFARSWEFAFVGAFVNFRVALRGIWAGVRGEIGRPDHVFPYLEKKD